MAEVQLVILVLRGKQSPGLYLLKSTKNASHFYSTQPKRITDDRHGTKTHGRRRDHRAQKQAESRIQGAGCNRHPKRVIHKGEKKVLFDVAHGGTAQHAGADNPPEVALDQGNSRAFHGDISAGAVVLAECDSPRYKRLLVMGQKKNSRCHPARNSVTI
jgi:hypothetical protein